MHQQIDHELELCKEHGDMTAFSLPFFIGLCSWAIKGGTGENKKQVEVDHLKPLDIGLDSLMSMRACATFSKTGDTVSVMRKVRKKVGKYTKMKPEYYKQKIQNWVVGSSKAAREQNKILEMLDEEVIDPKVKLPEYN